jgi:hypothetical protein
MTFCKLGFLIQPRNNSQDGILLHGLKKIELEQMLGQGPNLQVCGLEQNPGSKTACKDCGNENVGISRTNFRRDPGKTPSGVK